MFVSFLSIHVLEVFEILVGSLTFNLKAKAIIKFSKFLVVVSSIKTLILLI